MKDVQAHYIKKIGIDIMGVILPKEISHASLEDFMACVALPNVVESIKQLVDTYGAADIFIVSRCPESAEIATIRWFYQHDFFAQTGFNRKNIYFCREQADKAPIAASLNLNYFIDDTKTVLDFMKDDVAHRIQLGLEVKSNTAHRVDDIARMPDWPAALDYIMKTHE